MELQPDHVNDWLCESRIQTSLSQQELQFRLRQPQFVPPILAERSGNLRHHSKGAVFIMFELVQLRYDDALEEAAVIVDCALVDAQLQRYSQPYSVHIRPLTDPNNSSTYSNNVTEIKLYRKTT